MFCRVKVRVSQNFENLELYFDLLYHMNSVFALTFFGYTVPFENNQAQKTMREERWFVALRGIGTQEESSF